MKKDVKWLGLFLDVCVISASFILAIKEYLNTANINWTWSNLILTIVGVAGVLLLKAARMYFILMAHKMPLLQFGRFYIYTSCVSLVLPYKTGEIFRAYKLAYDSKNMLFGIIAVIIDRLFDSIPLCLIMVYSYWDMAADTTFLLKLVLLFIIAIGGLYWAFPSAYRLVNHFLIFKSESRGGLRALGLLENLKNLYSECERIIKDKAVILFLLSSAAWIIEILTAYMNSFVNGERKLSKIVLDYVNGVVFGRYNMVQIQFTQCAIVLLFIGVICFGLRTLKGRRGA